MNVIPTIVCTSCGYKNWSKFGKLATCGKCGKSLLEQNKTNSFQKTEPAQIVIVRDKIEGEFRQHGILCMRCKSVTSLGNKKCQACGEKLRLNPNTTVYFNGIKEAIQCKKCGKYTSFKDMKCEYCGKKFGF